MIDTLKIYEELREEVSDSAAKKIAYAIGRVYEELANVVTKQEFRELKGIVEDLAEAQKRTEQRVEELAQAQKNTELRLTRLEKAVEELAQAQKRTEQRVEELAQAQKNTELRLTRLEKAVEELAQAQKRTEEEVRKLARGLQDTRSELGGLSRTISYAFENEAFRMLPNFLKTRYNIEIFERLVREEIGGKEINIFGRAKRNGDEIFIIGEAKLRLDERRENIEDIFSELEEKERLVKTEYGEKDTIKILITHFATKGALKKAQEKGIIVVQSFEW